MDKNTNKSCCNNNSAERKTIREHRLKTNLLSRLNKIEGQIRGISKMIVKDAYCDDVLIQVAAARSALNSVGKVILENHIKSCFVNRIKGGEDEAADEIITIIKKMM